MVTEDKSRLGTYVTTTVTGEPVLDSFQPIREILPSLIQAARASWKPNGIVALRIASLRWGFADDSKVDGDKPVYRY